VTRIRFTVDRSKDISAPGATIDGTIEWDVCGHYERGAAMVKCECGCLRQANRPHGYRQPTK